MCGERVTGGACAQATVAVEGLRPGPSREVWLDLQPRPALAGRAGRAARSDDEGISGRILVRTIVRGADPAALRRAAEEAALTSGSASAPRRIEVALRRWKELPTEPPG